MISGLGLFPGGTIGGGLLLLRVSVATSLIMLSVRYFGGAYLLLLLAVLAAVGLCAGIRTRAIAGLSLAVPIFGFTTAAGFVPLAILHTLDVLVLLLTGPGAWSTDAISFGRRTVTLSGRSNTIT